jgi:hypothetical protein
MKTVIHAWTNEFNINQEHIDKYNYLNETNFYFGIGDLIRSTIKLYYLSKVLNFKLIVDIQLHPIAEFLKIEKHEYSEYVINNKYNVNYVCYGALEDYINNSESNIIMLLSNDFYNDNNDEIESNCKYLIKKIFTPTEKFREFILKKMNKIPFNFYNIFHYRINDNEFLNKSEELIYEYYLNHLIINKEKNDILITDTKKLKNYIYINDDIFMFDTKICHLGLSKDSDAIRDTLFEFFLITFSSKIKTFCKIHEVSGFVKWISKIYDIPLIIYNN